MRSMTARQNQYCEITLHRHVERQRGLACRLHQLCASSPSLPLDGIVPSRRKNSVVEMRYLVVDGARPERGRPICRQLVK